jgi:hypothetical protein
MTGVFNRLNITKSIVFGRLSQNIISIDNFNPTIEFIVVITGSITIAIFYPGDVSSLIVFGLGAMVSGIDGFNLAS